MFRRDEYSKLEALVACPMCGEERWVRMVKGSPTSTFCRKCNGKRLNGYNKIPQGEPRKGACPHFPRDNAKTGIAWDGKELEILDRVIIDCCLNCEFELDCLMVSKD